MDKLKEKGKKLQQAQELVQLLRDVDEAKFWIKDKVCYAEVLFENVLEVVYFSFA